VKRGELWTAAAGADYTSKPRPVIILQAAEFETLESVTFVGLTSEIIEDTWFRPVIVPDADNGLRQPSQVMIDKVQTIPRGEIRNCFGQLSATDMAAIDQTLLVFLGLA
jgi:mRNA interferase MazF